MLDFHSFIVSKPLWYIKVKNLNWELRESNLYRLGSHALQTGHCVLSFPSVSSSSQQSNHRDVLEEDSLAIRSVFFSSPLHLPPPSSLPSSHTPASPPFNPPPPLSDLYSWGEDNGHSEWRMGNKRGGRTVSLASPLAPFSPLGCVWVNTLQARDYKQPSLSLGSWYLGTTADEGWPLGPYTVHCVDMSISIKIKEKATGSQKKRRFIRGSEFHTLEYVIILNVCIMETHWPHA